MAAIIAFILRYPQVLIAALLGGALALLLCVNATHVHERDQARADVAAGKAALQATVDRYQAAAAVAAQHDAENVARVQADQAAITERVTNDLQARLDGSSAAYDRLRNQAAAYSSRPATADVSAAREATCHAYASASCDEIPGLLKAAQDNTDQLLGLIDWANSQAAVPVGNEATP